MAEIVYTGGNYPVSVGGVVIARVQSLNSGRTRTLTDEFQMGTDNSIGQSEGPWSNTFEINLNPISTQLERALTSKVVATDAVSLADLMAASSVTVVTPTRTVTGVVFVSARYSASTPDQTYNAAFQLRGLSTSSGSSVAAPSTAGLVSFKPKHIMVRFNSFSAGGANIMRIKSMTININGRSEDWFEFSNANPWYVDRLAPTANFSLTWYGSRDSVSPGTFNYDVRPKPDASSPDTAEIQLVPDGNAWDGSGNIKIELLNVVASEDTTSGGAETPIDDTISYSCSDPGATGGFRVSVIA